MQFQTVFNTDQPFVYQVQKDGEHPRYYGSLQDFLENCGYRLSGVHTSERTRDELQRQPVMIGLAGPMWNGHFEGRPVIRYEDHKRGGVTK